MEYGSEESTRVDSVVIVRHIVPMYRNSLCRKIILMR